MEYRYCIKIDNPEQSRKFQQTLIDHGKTLWIDGKVRYTDAKFLFFYTTGKRTSMTWGSYPDVKGDPVFTPDEVLADLGLLQSTTETKVTATSNPLLLILNR